MESDLAQEQKSLQTYVIVKNSFMDRRRAGICIALALRHRRLRLQRQAIPWPISSFFTRLLSRGDEADFFDYLRVSRQLFYDILQQFGLRFNTASLGDGGSSRVGRRLLSAEQALVIVLRHLAVNATDNDLACLSGASPSTVSRYRDGALRALSDALAVMPDAAVHFMVMSGNTRLCCVGLFLGVLCVRVFLSCV